MILNWRYNYSFNSISQHPSLHFINAGRLRFRPHVKRQAREDSGNRKILGHERYVFV
jgi:hypothetical protein